MLALQRLDAVSAVPPVLPIDVLKSPAEGIMFGNVRVEERSSRFGQAQKKGGGSLRRPPPGRVLIGRRMTRT
jgi:hypothetical protein